MALFFNVLRPRSPAHTCDDPAQVQRSSEIRLEQSDGPEPASCIRWNSAHLAQVRCGTGSVASALRNPRSATEVIGQTRVADIPRQHYCPIQCRISFGLEPAAHSLLVAPPRLTELSL